MPVDARWNVALQPVPRRLMLDSLAGRAGDIVAGGIGPEQHVASIAHLVAVDRRQEPVAKDVAAEISPEIHTTAEHLAIPIDLRHIPRAHGRCRPCEFAILLLVFLPRADADPYLLADEFGIPQRRKRIVPRQFRSKLHAEFVRHLSRQRQLVLVVAEDHELPRETRQIGVIRALVGVDRANVGDDRIEIPANAIDAVGLGASAVDRAGQPPHPELDDRLERLESRGVEVDTIRLR